MGAVVLFAGLLAAGYALRLSEVARAEQARDEARTEVAALETEVARLDEYAKLAERLENRSTLLASAMEKEIAFSHVLNDLSLAFPANASLHTLTITAAEAADLAAQTGEIDFGRSVASAEFSGYSVERYAPGVETVLLDVDRIPAFFNPFLTTAAAEEIGEAEVTNFTGSVLLNSDAYTGRYAEGVPPEDTP